MPSVIPLRRPQSFTARSLKWSRRHPLLAKGAVVLVGALLAWVCKHASETWAKELCESVVEPVRTFMEQLVPARPG